MPDFDDGGRQFSSATNDDLRDTVLDAGHSFYIMAEWSGANTSGMEPVCDRVLVLCDESAQEIGGVIVPDTSKERMDAAAMTGVLVAAGPQAFAYDSHRVVHWEGARPQPGDRVFYRKYAGNEYRSPHDGRLYRIMEDRVIDAIATRVETANFEAST